MAVAMRNKTGRFAPDYAIMLRRREEDHRQLYNEKTRVDNKLENVAKWEHSTSSRIERNVVSKQINTIKRDLEEHLNARRYPPAYRDLGHVIHFRPHLWSRHSISYTGMARAFRFFRQCMHN
jgi:hypothetical protein